MFFGKSFYRKLRQQRHSHVLAKKQLEMKWIQQICSCAIEKEVRKMEVTISKLDVNI